jgi:hypothetical protein
MKGYTLKCCGLSGCRFCFTPAVKPKAWKKDNICIMVQNQYQSQSRLEKIRLKEIKNGIGKFTSSKTKRQFSGYQSETFIIQPGRKPKRKVWDILFRINSGNLLFWLPTVQWKKNWQFYKTALKTGVILKIL